MTAVLGPGCGLLFMTRSWRHLVSADPYPVRRAGRLAVVTLPDEIDITNVGQARATLLNALTDGAAVVTADMTGTRFCCCQGVRALLAAAEAAASAGAVLRVTAGGPMVRRVLRLTGADRRLTIYPDLRAALAASPDGTGNGAADGAAADGAAPPRGR